MKNISLIVSRIIILLLFPLLSFGQEYHLKGFMGVQGGESFTYELELKETNDGSVIGTASTYLDQQQNVVATVSAIIDRSKKTLSIKEKTITANNDFRSNAVICLVEAVLVYDEKENKLSGQLITKTAGNGAECSKGSITFMNKEEIDNLFSLTAAVVKQETVAEIKPTPSKPKFDPSKPTKVVYDTIAKTAPAIYKKQPDNITEGKNKTYIWSTDTVIIDLWDGNNIDGDKVSLIYNGSNILANYTLTANKKRLLLPIGGNELNIITVEALNEGGDPPNTANMLLTDGTTTYDIIAHNAIGRKAIIMIQKKQ